MEGQSYVAFFVYREKSSTPTPELMIPAISFSILMYISPLLTYESLLLKDSVPVLNLLHKFHTEPIP